MTNMTETRIVSIAMLILTFTALFLLITANATTSNNSILSSLKRSNVLDLLYGNKGWYVAHVYQGDNDGTPTSLWPVFYNASEASQYYWKESGRDQPVLELVPSQGSASGAVFWSETYMRGNVTITILGTYTTSSWLLADGFYIYMFINPTAWYIAKNYNYSVPYYSAYYFSPVQGHVILPQSDSEYLLIEWDPFWSYTWWPHSGQWNVWIVSNPNGSQATVSPSPSPTLGSPYSGWDGIGSGYIIPNPGDYIYINVTYDPQTNILKGMAIDLNTSEVASFVLNLTGYYNLPLFREDYVFGVGAPTGGMMANWGVLYINYTSEIHSWLFDV